LLRFGDECAVESRVTCRGPLQVGQGSCDGDCQACPCDFDPFVEPKSHYVSTMIQQLQPLCSAGTSTKVLSIGLGGGELPLFLLNRCENMRVEAVELNPDVIEMARRFFGIGDAEKKFGDRFTVQQADALLAVEEKTSFAPDSYDAILIDCFGGSGSVPESCRSRRFAEGIKLLLKPSGLLLQNIWDYSPGHPEVATGYSSTVETYKSVFAGEVVSLTVPMPPNLQWVHVLRAAKENTTGV